MLLTALLPSAKGCATFLDSNGASIYVSRNNGIIPVAFWPAFALFLYKTVSLLKESQRYVHDSRDVFRLLEPIKTCVKCHPISLICSQTGRPYMIYDNTKAQFWITVSLWMWHESLRHNFLILSRLILWFWLKIFRIFLRVVARWWRARVSAICGCCDSRAAVFTNTWQRFVGKNNWACHGVDTYSCLQGWHKDLTLMAVQHRHQLGLEPEKMSFTSLHQHRHSLSSTTMTLIPSADDFSLFPLLYFLVSSTFSSPSF